jgi:serine/threonine protein kinase
MAVSFPRQFGKYVLLKPLAKGGMGEIYLAALGQLDGFDKLCVIKKVIPEKSDEGKAKRFLDEAKVVLRLTHSGLVNTFDAGQVDREFYIAMEMVEGKDLREVWNRCVRVRHRIPIEVALHVAREWRARWPTCTPTANLNLVHRDVAPPNIMLAYNGDVKLTDFGLARSALKQEHTQPGVVFGRAAYLAPEQARGEVADPRTDVYSLAVVLWELLTGHQYLQITGLDPAAALALVRHPKPTPPSTRAPWVTPASIRCSSARLPPTSQAFRQCRGIPVGAFRGHRRGRPTNRRRACVRADARHLQQGHRPKRVPSASVSSRKCCPHFARRPRRRPFPCDHRRPHQATGNRMARVRSPRGFCRLRRRTRKTAKGANAASGRLR